MKNFSLTLVILLFTLVGVGQETLFKTLASKGTCMVQRGVDPDEYSGLKTGVKLFENDKIIITGDNSYLGLVSSDGKSLELTKGGVYSVNDLHQKLAESKSGLAAMYLEYLVSDMSKTDERANANMKFTGSVERSIKNDGIILFLPHSTMVANTKAMVNWYPKEAHDSYTISITNLFDEEIFTKNTSRTSETIDFASMELSPEEVYKIQVKSNDSAESSVVTLNVPAEAKLQRFAKEVEEIKAQTPANTAIQNMVLAKYYDANELYLNAIPFYRAAVEMEPEVKEYRDAYNSFLFGIGVENLETK